MSYSNNTEINILLLDERNIDEEFILDIWDEDIIGQDNIHIIYHVRLNTIYGELDDLPIYQFIINHSTDIGSTASYINMDTSSEINMRTHKLYSMDKIPLQYPIGTKIRPYLYKRPHRRHGGKVKMSKKKRKIYKNKRQKRKTYKNKRQKKGFVK